MAKSKSKYEKAPFFCRIDSDINNHFIGKVAFSKYKREQIVEKLLIAYNKKGDELLDELDKIK